MRPEGAGSETANTTLAKGAANVSIESVLAIKERSLLERMLSSQAFWVTVVLVLICVVTSIREPRFATEENFFNVSRNSAFIGIMALGITAVIITGGIDLSVGSIMGLTAVVCGLMLEAGHTWYAAMAAGLLAGLLAGAINGGLIAYVGLPSFVVTLGMLAMARSCAVVLSGNRMLYNFGPHGDAFKWFGKGQIPAEPVTIPGLGWHVTIANPVWVLLILALVMAFVLHKTQWGRHLYAIGGNEQAAMMTGVPVRRIKMQAYIVSALTAAIAAILNVGWSGSAINALGTGYELRAIASSVIGGANLMGGEGGVYGTIVGTVLNEAIRTALLFAGIDSNWQGMFTGSLLVLAVLIQRIRGRRRD